MFSLKSGQFEIKDGEVLLVLMKMALKSCTIGNVIFTACLSRNIVLERKSYQDFDFGFSRSYSIVCS
jgi:hypothetical protein